MTIERLQESQELTGYYRQAEDWCPICDGAIQRVNGVRAYCIDCGQSWTFAGYDSEERELWRRV